MFLIKRDFLNLGGPYSDRFVPRSKKDWLCDKSHTGIETEDLMQYLDLISNALPEELPNLLRFNGRDRRVGRIMAIYHANKVGGQICD